MENYCQDLNLNLVQAIRATEHRQKCKNCWGCHSVRKYRYGIKEEERGRLLVFKRKR